MTRKILPLAVAFLASLPLLGAARGGCVTTSQGNELQAQVDVLGSRLDALEQDNQNLRGALDSTAQARGDLIGTLTEVQTELQQIRGALDDAQFTLSTLKTENEQMRASLETVVTELQTRLQVVEGKLGIQSLPPSTVGTRPPQTGGGATPTAPPTETDKQAYDRAYKAYQAGQLESARQLFRDLLRNYPKSPLAANAQFWIGEIYFRQKDYENAVLEYDKIVSQYPSSNKVAAAYLKMGFCFLEMGEKKDARSFFEKVVKDFPSSEQAAIAKKKLEQLR